MIRSLIGAALLIVVCLFTTWSIWRLYRPRRRGRGMVIRAMERPVDRNEPSPPWPKGEDAGARGVWLKRTGGGIIDD